MRNACRRVRRVLLLALLAVISTEVRAQVPPIYIGGGLTGAFNLHELNLPVYRNDTICGIFQSGTSILPSGFLTYERPLGAPSISFWIAPRLHFSSLGALITTPATDNANMRDVSKVDSPLVATSRVHHLDASILALGLDFFFKYPLTARLFLIGGPSASYLLRRDATRTEIITDPPGAVFSNGSGTRTLESGQIANSNSIIASATLGASIDLPLSPKVVLAPELSFTYPITSIRSDYSWRIMSVTLGAAIKFNVAHEQELAVIHHEPPPPPPPPEKPKSEITGTIHIAGVARDSVGNEHEFAEPQLRVEEFARREAYPTLNYVFFSDGSAIIPTRYHQLRASDAASFDPKSLSGKTSLEVYHEALNIVGYRMRQNPTTTITLTGTNAMAGTEAAMSSLARDRAETVRNYLASVWTIDPKRIQIATEGLPKNASGSSTNDGADENRRVEITSNDPGFLDPLTVETVDRTMNPPKIRMRATESSRYPLVQNDVLLTQGSREFVHFNGALPVQDWTPVQTDLPRTDTPLVATMRLKDDQGATFEASDTAHVELVTIKHKREERVLDKIIEHYNLITFDFDKSDLDDRSRRIIREIASSITPNDKIVILGYTDLTGERTHNLQLSEIRAKNVESALRDALGSHTTSVEFQTRGEGMINLIDNHLPEGRFLSRTVFVELQKPVE
ncbi:MAG: OmpA family protein [Bacteroidota bacterium]|nr:OmpA family protein [Bacteroidota bacterium]MDP4233532.1 OmpA family protein [Bacteroidota bacterium]MDP4287718.1 OmpA family protein [Bacteroidota bacterium]